MGKLRVARMQRRAARASMKDWAKANSSQLRDGIIAQLEQSKINRRWVWVFRVFAALAITASAAFGIWWGLY